MEAHLPLFLTTAAGFGESLRRVRTPWASLPTVPHAREERKRSASPVFVFSVSQVGRLSLQRGEGGGRLAGIC